LTKREELVKIEESHQNFLFYLTKKAMKEVFTQSASEIQEIAWVVDNVKSELQELKKEFFFEKDDKEVRYNMNAIKDYLSFLKDKSWNELAKEHQFSATMAVQIALRKLGYQSGKVDGIL